MYGAKRVDFWMPNFRIIAQNIVHNTYKTVFRHQYNRCINYSALLELCWIIHIIVLHTYISSPLFPIILGTLQGTPRSTLHLPLTGSGGATLTKGGSSKNPTVRWNFSGTPWGGTWLWPGQTMSLKYRAR